MTTAEKRAELEASGESWPDCECHGEPKLWQRDTTIATGGWFHCRVRQREWRQARRQQRRSEGVCIHCGGELATETMCRSCADKHSDHMAGPKQRLAHWKANSRYRRRFTFEGFQPTGAGLAAFAAWLQEPTGEVD